MPDMAPMQPCPVGPKGRHRLSLLIPDVEADATLACRVCGAVRRFPVTGPLPGERLDDLSAEEIAAAVGRSFLAERPSSRHDRGGRR